MSRFEDGLWAELKQEHAPELLRNVAQRRRGNAARWVGAAAVVATLGTGAVVAPAYFGGTPPAYAVVDNPDGSVTLTLRDLAQYEEALEQLRLKGVPVVAESLLKDCPPDDRRKIEQQVRSSDGIVLTFGRVDNGRVVFDDLVPIKAERTDGKVSCVFDTALKVHTGPLPTGPTR